MPIGAALMPLLGGLGSSLGADLVGKLGTKVFGGGSDALWGSGGVGDYINKSTDATINAQNKMFDNLQARIPGLMNQLNYNAMGQTGQSAALGAQNALDKWTNSAQGVSTANRLTSDADALRSVANTQGTLALGQNQQQAGQLVNDTVRSLTNSGASPAAVAAAAGKIAGAMGQNNQNLLAQSAGALSQNLGAAANLTSQAQQGLLQDKAMEYKKVEPFLNQRESATQMLGMMANAAGDALRPALGAGAQGFSQGIQPLLGNQLGGLTTALGVGGGELLRGGFNNLWAGDKPQLPTK